MVRRAWAFGVVLLTVVALVPAGTPGGSAVGSCAMPAVPAPIGGSIVGELVAGASDTWWFDVAPDTVVANAVSFGGQVRLIFEEGCGPDATRCINHGPIVPPNLGAVHPGPSCELSRGSITVEQTPFPTLESVHYVLRVCGQSVTVGPPKLCTST